MVLLAICASAKVSAQKAHSERNNIGPVSLIHFSLGYQRPAGDLAKRFGPCQSLGLSAEHLTANNWALGANGQFFFGENVKEDPIAGMRTANGGVINSERVVATVSLRERGWYAGATAGRLWATDKRRSGLRLTLGAGWQTHWIRVQDESNLVTQLTGDYRKGYDRRAGGPTLSQFVGWQSLGASRTVNWFVGAQVQEGFTKSLRDWDFATQGPLTGKRLDVRLGFVAGWSFAIYQQPASQVYY